MMWLLVSLMLMGAASPDEDLWLGILPGWVGDLVTIILAALGLPAIILWWLNRRNANRHLNVEEGGLAVNEFGEIKSGYRELWEAAKKDAADAKADAAAARADAAAARKDADKSEAAAESANSHAAAAENSVRKLHKLIEAIVRENSLTLTTTQVAILEETLPRPRPRGRGK